MPTVPLIEKNYNTAALPTVTSGARISAPQIGAPQLRAPQMNLPRLQVNTAGMEASVRLGQTLMNESYDLAVQSKNRADRLVTQEARRKLSEWEDQNIFEANSGALTKRGKDAFNLPDTYIPSYDKFTQEIYDGLSNDAQREAFSEMALSRRLTISRTLERHSRTEMDAFEGKQATAGIAAEQNRAILYGTNNPDVLEESIRTAQDIAYTYGKSKGLPDEAIRNELMDIESKTLMGVLSTKAEDDPKSAIEFYKTAKSKMTADDLLRAENLMKPVERKYKATAIASQVLNADTPKIARDDVIDYVMNDLEGGDKVVSDGGGVAKFGINSVAHPDVDVPNLTPEGARNIYRKDYWDAIGADKMPADMRLVAYDAAVNHGLGKAKEMVEQSGGDVRKLIELRQEEYARLVRENPEKYGPSAEGWSNRLAKVQAQVEVLRGKQPTAYEVSSRIDSLTDDPDVSAAAKTLALRNLKAIEDDRKAKQRQANEEAFAYVSSGREVPATVEARMSGKDIAAMRRGAPANPEVYEDLRARIIAGQPVELGDYVWQLGNRYTDLVKLQQDPSKQANGRKVDDVIKNSTRMLIGKSSPKTPDDFDQIENFRRAVDREIEAFQRDGKTASAADVEKITDRLLLTVEAGDGLFGGSDKRMFEVQPGERFEVDGVPDNRKLIIGGQQVAYPDVIKNITDYLEARDVRVSQESIAETYKALVKKKLIVEQYE